MINLWLFYQFARFSIVLFGGGYMIVPMLNHIFVDIHPLLSVEQFGNLLSIAQMTPGPISLNAATYVGFLENGVLGALFASFGLVAPTIILSLTAIALIQRWQGTFWMKGLLLGTRMVGLAMVVYACLIFACMSVYSEMIPWKAIGQSLITFKNYIPISFQFNEFEAIVAVSAFALVTRYDLPITALLILSAIAGFSYSFFV
ncbi:MAG: chromate transporter [Alphaproteobacteria bacterium]|nr:chromate transporter [Alphaproteobacteria bacterium]